MLNQLAIIDGNRRAIELGRKIASGKITSGIHFILGGEGTGKTSLLKMIESEFRINFPSAPTLFQVTEKDTCPGKLFPASKIIMQDKAGLLLIDDLHKSEDIFPSTAGSFFAAFYLNHRKRLQQTPVVVSCQTDWEGLESLRDSFEQKNIRFNTAELWPYSSEDKSNIL